MSVVPQYQFTTQRTDVARFFVKQEGGEAVIKSCH
jgi:hypothetical protein